MQCTQPSDSPKVAGRGIPLKSSNVLRVVCILEISITTLIVLWSSILGFGTAHPFVARALDVVPCRCSRRYAAS